MKEYQNNITDFLDECMYEEYKVAKDFLGEIMTYILVDYDYEQNGIVSIRSYSGGTKGHIRVNDDDIIVEIKIYSKKDIGTVCFKEETNDKVQKFVGTKLTFNREVK